MDLFTRADLRTLMEEREGPCVSLFMSAHRGGAEEDLIRFRNLLGQAEEQLVAHGLRASEARTFLAPLQSLLADVSFWPNQCDGLAVFLARDSLRVYRLPWAFREELEVGGLFHVVPLLPLLAEDGRFYVLALSQNAVRLFQGTRFIVSPVDLKRVPRNLAEALVTHDRDEVLTFHSRPTSGGTWGAIFEGHGAGIDNKKDDLLERGQPRPAWRGGVPRPGLGARGPSLPGRPPAGRRRLPPGGRSGEGHRGREASDPRRVPRGSGNALPCAGGTPLGYAARV
jgi:hypothetical protein